MKVWRQFRLDKAWRKRPSLESLGGLNCVFVMTRFQEARWEGSPSSWGVEVSELADEGEQGPTSTYSKTKNLKCQRMKCDRGADAWRSLV